MPAARNNSKTPPRRVLVTRFSAIGDVAMTVPALYSACRLNPDVEFVIVTRPKLAAIMVNPPANLRIAPADVDAEFRGPQGMWRLLRRLERDYGSFDAVADLHNVIRTRLLSLPLLMRGAKIARLRKDRASQRALTRARNKILRPMASRAEEGYARVFHALGLQCRPQEFGSVYGPGQKASPGSFAEITEPKRDGEVWIGVAPFARHRGKIYPPELMARVVKSLAGNGTKVFLFGGGAEEQAVLDGWTSGRVVSLAGKRCGFATEMALMSWLDAMVSMDSANMHLAAIAGTRVVSVWGATHPYCGFRAFGQSEHDEVQLDLPCRPCSVFGNAPCRFGDHHCLTDIPPEAIAEKVKSITA